MPKRVSKGRAVKTSMRVGNWASLARASRAPKGNRGMRFRLDTLSKRLSSMSRTIETKENQWRTQLNTGYYHNQLAVINDTNGNPLNPFWMGNGNFDNGTGFTANANRIGDQITVKNVTFKLFFENAMGRPKVFYHLMLIRSAKGDTATRATLYKGNANNKMIDMIDRERYSVVAQKRFTVTASNPPPEYPNGVTGQPEADTILGVYNSGMATKIVTVNVPGRKFGKGGTVTYENISGTQLKFFDYRWYLMVYDWYGTPQDVNIVGRINEGYTKIYFKDA